MSVERMYLAFLTEKRILGESYKKSPQHLTLLPPFLAKPKNVVLAASDVARHFEPFTIKVDGGAFFGPKHDIPVVLIEPNPKLNSLHENLLRAMLVNSIDLVDDSYTGDNYQPHIAIKPRYPAPVTGQEFLVDCFTVMLKTELARIALAEVMLGKKYE